MTETTKRRQLLRWLGWFGLANAAILAVISLRYLSGWSGASSPLAWLYLVTIYISHYAWMTLLPMILVGLPVILLRPRRGLLTALGILLASLMVALITLDSLLWSQSHFHINLLTARILGPQSWIFVGVMFLIALLFESMLARSTWGWIGKRPRRGGRYAAAVVALSLLVAQGIYAWSDASYYTPVTSLGQKLPVHRGVTAKSFLVKSGLVDIEQARERRLAERVSSGMGDAATGSLRYPLEPLRCTGGDLNLLVIMLDSWRYDMLTKTHTPRIEEWADRHASQFQAHYSGGNSSKIGVFSFFYGLLPSYFRSFEAVQEPALLVSQLQSDGYRLGLFAAANMYRPVQLDRTAFANVPDLQLRPENPGDPSWKKDQGVNERWFEFLDGRPPGEKFFGFLFYDSPNTMQLPEGYPEVGSVPAGHPMADRFALYQASIHYTDTLVGQVLDDLDRRGLAEKTVVIVTADHGEEFQESGPEYRIHGSGFSRYQLQVPLLVAWPGREGINASYRTSHYDIAATLLGDLAGCENPPGDFSAGRNLFAGEDWPWLVAGSYYNYAVIEPDQVTVTFPNGLYQTFDADYQPLSAPTFRADVLSAVMAENKRFHR
jgi:membrane-anchored protein YejM (alkaline phosphatase superfamily)